MKVLLFGLLTLLLAWINCSLCFSVEASKLQLSTYAISSHRNSEQTMSRLDHTENSALGATADDEENDTPFLLPGNPNDHSIPSIKLGETIRFEDMGPVIINSDGTTRRIANWDQMTKHEQEVTWRRISKRNEERRKILLEAQLKQQNDDNMNNQQNDEL